MRKPKFNYIFEKRFSRTERFGILELRSLNSHTIDSRVYQFHISIPGETYARIICEVIGPDLEILFRPGQPRSDKIQNFVSDAINFLKTRDIVLD